MPVLDALTPLLLLRNSSAASGSSAIRSRRSRGSSPMWKSISYPGGAPGRGAGEYSGPGTDPLGSDRQRDPAGLRWRKSGRIFCRWRACSASIRSGSEKAPARVRNSSAASGSSAIRSRRSRGSSPMSEQALHRQKIRWFRAWEEAAGLDESERWQDNPPTARLKPELCIE